MSDILKIFIPCDACQSAGIEDGHLPATCDTCGGSGLSDRCMLLNQDLLDLIQDMNNKIDDIREMVAGG